MENSQPAFTFNRRRLPVLIAAALVVGRLFGLLTMRIDGLRGYGDMIHYHVVYGLSGWPVLNYWIEYPPIFPWIAALLNRLAGGQEHVFYYLLDFLLLLADAGSVYLFARLVTRIFPGEDGLARAGAYLLALVALPYGWWYFDPLVVFTLLLGLNLILDGRAVRGGLALAAGIALKFFPGLALLAGWQRYSTRKLITLAAVSLAPLILMYALFWRVSPDFTLASLRAQASKGSWETVWALVDGNIRTGSLGPLEERLDPAKATQLTGNPPVVPPLALLVVFAGVGLWGLSRFKLAQGPASVSDRQSIALVGFAWSLFALWSQGWSPQWVLYLLPLILLTISGRQAYLLALALVFVNLLEWPVLLSRGYFWGLYVTAPVRTLLLILLAVRFYREMRPTEGFSRDCL